VQPAGPPRRYSELKTMPHFDKNLTVEQAFKTHAGARRVFARFHLGGCSNCAISETETIEQVSEGYGIPLNVLMDDSRSCSISPRSKSRCGAPARRNSLQDPAIGRVPELGKVTDFAAGAYTVEFGDVRLQASPRISSRPKPPQRSEISGSPSTARPELHRAKTRWRSARDDIRQREPRCRGSFF